MPAGLRDVTAIAAGGDNTVALKTDGTVVAWGNNATASLDVPAGLRNVTAIAAGAGHLVALFNPPPNSAPTALALSSSSVAELGVAGTTVGTFTVNEPWDTHTYALVAGTGDTGNAAFTISGDRLLTNTSFDFETQSSYSIRVQATDSAGLRLEEAFTVTITDVREWNGTPTAWGQNGSGQTTVPPGLVDIVAIAAGGSHTVVLHADGTVAAWGRYDLGQTRLCRRDCAPRPSPRACSIPWRSRRTVPSPPGGFDLPSSVPAGLSTVTAIAAGDFHTVALKADGTVIAWGLNGSGQTTVPAGLATSWPSPRAPTTPWRSRRTAPSSPGGGRATARRRYLRACATSRPSPRAAATPWRSRRTARSSPGG